MTTLGDGTVVCDGCGAGAENGSLAHAVTAFAVTPDGNSVSLHWCLSAAPPNRRCAQSILAGAMGHRPGGPIDLYDPAPTTEPAT